MPVKVQSQTTPSHKMQVRSWLAELVMLRSIGSLPAYFWRDSRWRGKYTSEVRAVSKFIKVGGELNLVKIAEDRSIVTWTDYALVQYLLSREQEKFRKAMMPKDREPPKTISYDDSDLREAKYSIKNKSTFEKLDSL